MFHVKLFGKVEAVMRGRSNAAARRENSRSFPNGTQSNVRNAKPLIRKRGRLSAS